MSVNNYEYICSLSEESMAFTLAKIHLDGFKVNPDDEIPDDVMFDEVNLWKKFLNEDRESDGI